MNYIIKILNRYVVAKEIKIPYPTIAELSLGASPAIAANAPAVAGLRDAACWHQQHGQIEARAKPINN